MIRVNRFPPCPLPEKCLGLGSHSDPHALTILLQDHVGGLQVLKTDHQWVGIRPIPNSFVINIGDTLEAWTNGRLKSVVHRAVVNKEKQRLSAAYFLSPSSSAIIDCPPQLMVMESWTQAPIQESISLSFGKISRRNFWFKRG
ncbi:gibberellin 2-beta-dioxygenase 8 [Quercus suber]|uniref:Gibberellin 2-beta-dioxygenase 8 n=1 Tax=Quercus suber TaxID=58331 RepID=A0AAW0LH01_QUESU